MSANYFEAQVRQQNGIAIIDLHGEINGDAEEALTAAYAQATSQQSHNVLLNFAGVDYINSKGIALIVVLLAQARKAGRRLLTSGLSDHYVEIFKITRLSDFMTVFPDEASAIADARGERVRS
jgi:anti-sigma B factor antagonist